MGSTALVIRRMAPDDVDRVVAVHLAAFRGFFLSFLGPRFLHVLYEQAVAEDEIALVAEVDGRVVGFVVGSAEPARFFRALIRRRLFGFAVSTAPAVLRRPRILWRVARALTKPREAARPLGTATLMSLGTDPANQRAGTGRALVAAFIDEARRRGSTKVDLTTDKMGNDRVNAFYCALGFRLAREIVTPERRVLNEYEIDVPPT